MAPTPPPFRLPGTHFLCGIGWLALGAAGLVVVAPLLAAGQFLAPRVIAVTHIFTLGVITGSIFGALYQFYPMSLGAAPRHVRAGVAGAWLLQVGTALLVAGLWWWVPALQAAGWGILFVVIGIVAWNLLPHRRRMERGPARTTASYVSGAHILFGLAFFLAGARIGNSLGWWTLDRLGLIAAHFHLAAFGFAGLTAVGVGSRMLPMFMVAARAPSWPVRYIGPLGSAGLVALAAGLTLAIAPLAWLGAALSLAAAALFLRLVAGYFRFRMVRRLEPAFGHVLIGFLSLAAAAVTGLLQLATPGHSARGAIVYAGLTLLGWLVIFITGIWYRLLAFLIWLHFYGRDGATRVRTAAEIVHRPTAWATLALLATGIAMLFGGVGAGDAGAARAGSLAFAAGALLLVAHYAVIFARR
ncbi:MAG TPA: hypothetical protein VFT04_08980 [Gemmatimonadales bacterium]|nr:hypothetical protein [Gemmatimonadales bacterium]